MIKKLCAVSLVSHPKVLAQGAFNGEYLVIDQLTPLNGRLEQWQPGLLETVDNALNKQFLVLVEDVSRLFNIGYTLTLDQSAPAENRSYQNIALDYYFALTGLGEIQGNQLGNIIFQHGLQRHQIHRNSINIDKDDKGRNRYDIDYQRFTGYQRAVLLLVLGALHFNPASRDYLTQLLGSKPPDKLAHLPPGLVAIIRGR
ncbi:hypothetical protein [Spartinivicinus ruber]|uniref:hypothetical protein n=1 Tax=Spartinivicinus ruber TaxID=2683272 RepID=UPI0013CFACCC|nr:hypothetical protein [Spartinivicinus ruber]